jgi:nucleotide-binding universal stress UspA family protein
MEKLNTILVTLDLEAGSDAVLARAVQLTAAHAARLIVLHVVEEGLLPQTGSYWDLSESELRERLERHAVAALEPLLLENGRERQTDVRVEFGSAHEVIERVAREQQADIILLGPGKGHTLKDKVLGSTADRVIRMSFAPVLVAKGPSSEPYRRLAVAVDGSAQSARAVTEALRLAPEADAQLIHAIEIPMTFQQAMLRAGTSQAEMARYCSARTGKAREELSTFQREVLGAEKLPVRILDGEAGPALVRFSKRSRIDLLALGTHRRGAAMQALLGSVARRVLAEAACDVLVVASAQ